MNWFLGQSNKVWADSFSNLDKVFSLRIFMILSYAIVRGTAINNSGANYPKMFSSWNSLCKASR